MKLFFKIKLLYLWIALLNATLIEAKTELKKPNKLPPQLNIFRDDPQNNSKSSSKERPAKSTAPSSKTDELNIDCEQFLAAPFVDLLYQNGSKIFYLARQSSGHPDKFQYDFYQLDLDALPYNPTTNRYFNATLRFSFIAGPYIALVPSLQKSPGIAFIEFDQDHSRCPFGYAQVYYVQAATAGKPAQRRRLLEAQDYGIIEADQGRVIVDVIKRQILDIDFFSGQRRSFLSYYKSDLPLFFNLNSRLAWVWRPSSSLLLQYRSIKARPRMFIKLLPQDKILLNQDHIGLYRIDPTQNLVGIRRIEAFSEQDKNGYTVAINKDYPVSQYAASVHWSQKRLFLIPKYKVKRPLPFMIYDYEHAKLISQQYINDNEQIIDVVASPSGQHILVFTQGRGDLLHKAVRYYNAQTNQWYAIRL